MKNYKFTIHGTQYEVEINSVEDQTIKLNLNGTPYEVKVDKEIKQTKTPKLVRPVAVPSTESDTKVARTNAAGAASEIKSPLPGTVLDVMVKEGDTVKVGQHLLLLEAMKMENNIDSDKEGVVKSIKVRKGDAVMEGDVLIVME
ncbi:MAG: biotin/lipoyl-binding protein [Bacteroidales bacterium]|nr:biotin/lipoyl-binding protein [Bacteroidales bacterium]